MNKAMKQTGDPSAVSAAVMESGQFLTLCGTDLAAALGPLRITRFVDGEIIYREGIDAQCVYLVSGGLVKLVSHVSEDRTRIVRLLTDGDFVGVDGFFGGRYRQTAISLGDTSLYRIPLGLVKKLRSMDLALYCELLERGYAHLDYADTWIAQFSSGPIRSRVARLLLFLARSDPSSSPSEVHLLTCQDTADVLGVTTESVSRHLAEFKRKAFLRCDPARNAHSYVCDLTALAEVGDGFR